MSFNNYVVIEYYFPKEGKFDDVMEESKKSLQLFQSGIKGLQMAQVLKPTTKNGPIGMLSIWDSKEALGNLLKNMDTSTKEGVENVKEWTDKIEFQMFDGVDGWHLS
jgi:heme-degrading monooxygenase HmoA